MIRKSRVAAAVFVSLLSLPAVALAQSAPSTPGASVPPATTASPTRTEAVPGGTVEQRVNQHIRDLHGQLRITAAEEPQWQRFADIMRENARAMDQDFAERREHFATMNALQDMQSYERIAEAHAQHLQRLVPAFENLYNAMPEQQKRLTDQVFRQNGPNGRKRMQTGSNLQR